MIAMTPDTTIFYCREPVLALKLPVQRDVSQVFFRWQHTSPSVDAGVPAEVAHALASALCNHFSATFIAPSALTPPKVLNEWQRHGSHWAQTQRRLLSQKMPLIWSRDPAVVAMAFDENWTTEGQFILLSTLSEPFAFDGFKLQGDTAFILKFLMQGEGMVGAVLPGVDGDFAGLYGLDERRLSGFLDVDLPQSCVRRGIHLHMQSAAAFAPGARSGV